MAVLTVQTVSRSGLQPSLAAAAGGGDSFANTGNEFVYISNGGGGSITLTIVTQSTVDGQAVADRTVSVPAGESRFVGPFPTSHYNDANGRVQLTYSGVTSVTVAICKLSGVS